MEPRRWNAQAATDFREALHTAGATLGKWLGQGLQPPIVCRVLGCRDLRLLSRCQGDHGGLEGRPEAPEDSWVTQSSGPGLARRRVHGFRLGQGHGPNRTRGWMSRSDQTLNPPLPWCRKFEHVIAINSVLPDLIRQARVQWLDCTECQSRTQEMRIWPGGTNLEAGRSEATF